MSRLGSIAAVRTFVRPKKAVQDLQLSDGSCHRKIANPVERLLLRRNPIRGRNPPVPRAQQPKKERPTDVNLLQAKLAGPFDFALFSCQTYVRAFYES